MNYALDDAPSQNHHEFSLPLLARATTVTQVPPAKTITFFKKGDPRFGGVRMVVNPRMFKSFNALMDELSHHIPLSFGVRTITTPQGVHCVSSLEQLEDGGCYVCSDKNPSKALGGSSKWPTGSSSSGYPTQRINTSEDWQETPSWQGPRAPKKLTLVKNGDIGFRRSLILGPKNTQNLKAFLNDASEVLHFPVNHLYNPDGRKVESLQSLLQGPSTVVCAGQEPFRPMALENSRRRLPDKLPGLTSKKRTAHWELKAKKSVIHSRSESSNRSRQLSLTSEKSYLNGSRASIRSGSPVPTTNTNAPEKSAGLIPFGANEDDVEKKVHVNKDGSLSVEMKVRFRLLSEEMLQWSTHIRKATHLMAANGDDLRPSGVALFHPSRENNVQRSSEVDTFLCPDETNPRVLEEASYQGCQQPQPKYEIWKNPVHVSQGQGTGTGRSSWITQSPCSGASLFRQAIHQTKASGDSLCTTSGGEPLECSAPGSSCYSGILEGMVQCSDKDLASGQRNLATAASSDDDDDGEHEYTPIGKNNKSCDGVPDSHRKSYQKTQGTKTGRKWLPDKEKGNEACLMDCLEDEAQDAAEHISASSVCSRCREKRMHVAEKASGSPGQEGAFCSYGRETKGTATMAHSTPSCGPSRKSTPQMNSAQEGSGSSLVGPCSLKNKVLETEEEEHCRIIQDTGSGSVWKMPRAMVNDEFSDLEWSCIPHSSCPSVCSGSKGWGSPKSNGSLHDVSHSSRVYEGSKSNQPQMKGNGDKGTSYILEGSPERSLPRRMFSFPLLEKPRADNQTSISSRCSSKAKQKTARDPGSSLSSAHCLECLSRLNDASITREDNPDQKKLENVSNSSHSDPNFLEKMRGVTKANVSSPEPRSSNTSDSSALQGIAESWDEKSLEDHPRVSLELKIIEPQVEESNACRSSCSSQSSKTQPSSTYSDKLLVLPAKRKNASGGAGSWTGSEAGRSLPTPPRGMPHIRKGKLTAVKYTSGSSRWNANLGGRGSWEEKTNLNLSCPIIPGSRSVTTNQTKRARKDGPSPGLGRKMPRKNSRGGKPYEMKKNLGKPDSSTGIIPSDLPSASPEEVVYEWLSKIPEESILMSYEMQDDSPGAAVETPEEDLGVKDSPEVPGEMSQAQESALDREDSGGAPLDENPRVDTASPKAGGSLTEEKSSSTAATIAEGNPGECADLGVKTNLSKMEDLPSTLYSSVQIMKTLLSSKQSPKLGRFNSLPEVSQTMGRKLSHSAHVLITCLASLHFFDEELMTVTNQLTYMNSPKYQELLSIFQALWTECNPRTDEASSKGLSQTPLTGDFTPMSSSGVDVSSGSGGSGEGSVAGVVDCAPFPEKMEGSNLKGRDSTTCHDDIDPITLVKEENKGSFSNGQVKMEVQSTERDEEGRSTHDVTSRDEANESLKEQMLENSMRVVDEAEVKEAGMEEEKMLEKEMQEGETQDEGMKAEKIQEEEKQAEETKDEKVLMERMQEEEGIQEGEASKEWDSTDSCPPVNTEEPTEQVHNLSKDDSNSDSVHDGQALDPPLKEVTEGVTVVSGQSVVNTTSGTGVKRASIIQNTSPDPDPLWVLRLLKKIEKEFMTHYVNAMSEFKVRWNLQNNEILDQMIIELKNEVNQRIQKSIEKELRKIQSRAGKKLPKPPKEAFRWETSLQTEQRRRRLKGMHNHSAFTEQNKTPGKRYLSLAFNDAMVSSSTLGDDLRELEGEEEFCPCDTCIRKKMTSMSLKNPTPAADAPVRKAFDLQQILLKKKEEKLNEGAAELATKEQGSKALQREHTGNEVVDEAEPGLASSRCMDGADAGEGNPREDGESELHKGEEQETNHGETMTEGGGEADLQNSEEGDKEGKAKSDLEEDNEDEKQDEGESAGDGSEKKETGPASEFGANSEQEATGDGDRCSEASDGADKLQATEPLSPQAEVEKQTESQSEGRSQEDQKSSWQEIPGETQTGERSEESNSEQEASDGSVRTNNPPEALRSSPRNKETVFSSTSSTENCSQASQKGSEKEGSEGDCQESESPEAEPSRESNSENKAFTMYPENSPSEKDEKSSCSSTSEKDSTGSPDLERKERLAKNSKFTEVIDKADIFDDNCLDF
ncbi:retinitis pigmentosa 1-like 1 protein [Dromiciops gliroides]|uniref:retinitis pigmentosa 1-like 1 protein n=1 Tax=Dromiciops gliroides TaxID=33562 RepID=UPI001CC65C1C|nr:retinitis pigmentosa 1-like 1 protein [Dromiciops gliroides]